MPNITETLYQVLRTSNISVTLPRLLNNQLDHINIPWISHTQGRLLYDTLQRTYYPGAYDNHPHALLGKLCAMYYDLPETPTFRPHYRAYKTTDIVLEQDYNYSYNSTNTAAPITIHILHVPKGKTLLENAIQQNPPNGERKRIYESQLIQNQQHYVRVYTNHCAQSVALPTNVAPPVLIITDTINYKLIDDIYTLLPHFLNLTEPYMSLIKNPPETPDFKQNLLKHIVELFQYFYDNPQKSVEEHCAFIQQHLNELNALFKDDSANLLKAFTDNFSKIRARAALTHVDNSISRAQSDIATYTEALDKAYEKLYNAQIQKAQLINQSPEDVSILTNMLTKNKHIEILDTGKTFITIKVTAPLQYYRVEDFELLYNNNKSVFYLYLNDDNQKLLHAAIAQNKFQILVQAIITLTVQNSSSSPLHVSAVCEPKQLDCLPNPHLTYYNCWSAAKSHIQDAICKGDYELVIPQIITAVQSINMAESQTFYNRFIPDFNKISVNTPIFYDPETDKTYTKLEAMRLLTEQTTTKSEESETPKAYTQTEIEDDDDMWEDIPTPTEN